MQVSGRHPILVIQASVTAAAFIAYQQVENHVLNPWS